MGCTTARLNQQPVRDQHYHPHLPVGLNFVDFLPELFQGQVGLRLAQLDSDQLLLQVLHVIAGGTLQSQVGLHTVVSSRSLYSTTIYPVCLFTKLLGLHTVVSSMSLYSTTIYPVCLFTKLVCTQLYPVCLFIQLLFIQYVSSLSYLVCTQLYPVCLFIQLLFIQYVSLLVAGAAVFWSAHSCIQYV